MPTPFAPFGTYGWFPTACPSHFIPQHNIDFESSIWGHIVITPTQAARLLWRLKSLKLTFAGNFTAVDEWDPTEGEGYIYTTTASFATPLTLPDPMVGLTGENDSCDVFGFMGLRRKIPPEDIDTTNLPHAPIRRKCSGNELDVFAGRAITGTYPGIETTVFYLKLRLVGEELRLYYSMEAKIQVTNSEGAITDNRAFIQTADYDYGLPSGFIEVATGSFSFLDGDIVIPWKAFIPENGTFSEGGLGTETLTYTLTGAAVAVSEEDYYEPSA